MTKQKRTIAHIPGFACCARCDAGQLDKTGLKWSLVQKGEAHNVVALEFFVPFNWWKIDEAPHGP